MIGVRKSLDWVFTQRELKILDDALPEFSRRNQMVDEDEVDEEVSENGVRHLKFYFLNVVGVN